MTRSIFFLYYRSGSTLFECLCGKPWRLAQALGDIEHSNAMYNEWRESNEPFYLAAMEPCVAEDITVPIEDALLKYKDAENFSYLVHVGDWWGACSSEDIPGPFGGDVPSRWGITEIIHLPDLDNWRFVALMRDGRNQIESLRRMKGGYEEECMKRDPDDYFKVLCKGFRNRAAVALSCQAALPTQYRIFRFEDLIQNPPLQVSCMLRYVGLTFDPDRALWPSGKRHSSFGEAESQNQRWHSWTEGEKDIFKQIAGKQLIGLGYEKDNNW